MRSQARSFWKNWSKLSWRSQSNLVGPGEVFCSCREAKARTGDGKVEVSVRQSLVTPSELPVSLLRYVIRTQESVILDDASVQNLFAEDEYVRQRRPRSVLCLPLVKQVNLVGILYLENSLAPR